ncbi:MAG: tRNA pseudouridine(38-40) synthase TruA [Acidobacteriota bacterium]
MTKYKIVIQYVGTRYAGWQIQKSQTTVQGTIKDAVQAVTAEDASVVGAGRTDAGVHALRQVAHFSLAGAGPPGEKPARSPRRLQRSLNAVLPPDIRITSLTIAHPRFHAQKDALRKRYEYRIYNGHVLSPFQHGLVNHVISPLDWRAMQQAAQVLQGRHDFSGFAAAASRVKSKERTVFSSTIRKKGRLLTYRVEADGFLHHMVRNIAGTLLQIGAGKRPVQDLQAILKSRDRRKAGPTAPAHSLFLIRIWY